VAPKPRRPTALLIDFDGVIRHFDPAVHATAEERYGLPPGTVLATAVAPDRLIPAITGRATRAEWLTGIAEALADRVGGLPAARSLVVEWNAYRGALLPAAVAFVRAVRQAGVPVGLATNATDTLPDEVAALGLADDFDALVSSARVGVAKPHPDFYLAGCAALRAQPWQCLFVDDTDRNVRGARAVGLTALRYNGPLDFRYLRRSFGLD
jgi:putative hydrolase of the HAD superfamily